MIGIARVFVQIMNNLVDTYGSWFDQLTVSTSPEALTLLLQTIRDGA